MFVLAWFNGYGRKGRGGREGQAVWVGTKRNWLDTSGLGEIEMLPPLETIAVTSFSINNGVTRTTRRMVTLNNTATGNPTHYRASESPDFTGARWRAYSATPRFKLSKGNGTKMVYFMAKNADGVSNTVNNSIELEEAAVCTNPHEPNDNFTAAYGPLTLESDYTGKIKPSKPVNTRSPLKRSALQPILEIHPFEN